MDTGKRKLTGLSLIHIFSDWEDEEEVKEYLGKLLDKQAFDRKGLIYGMGHAVYSLSDPRARVFKHFVEALAIEKGRHKDFARCV